MTTIAYRNGELVSDSRAYSGGATAIGFKQKTYRLPDGGMIGISTTVPGLSEEVAVWMSEDRNPDHAPTVESPVLTILWITPAGDVYMALDSYRFTGPLTGNFFAIGSGDHYALGAMACGVSALEAVKVAKQLDIWTDGELNCMKLNS
jgi:hypothetical protein